jgi:hypothetical protein
MEAVLQNDRVTTRNNLLRYLRHLTANEWPEYPGEYLLPQEAQRLLHEAHIAALRFIGIQLKADPVAREFVQAIDDSIPGSPHLHSAEDTLRAARMLAPRFLQRLEREQHAKEAEARLDPVGNAKREYLRSRAEFDPFCKDGNVAVDGLTSAKTQIRIDPMDGSVITEF